MVVFHLLSQRLRSFGADHSLGLKLFEQLYVHEHKQLTRIS